MSYADNVFIDMCKDILENGTDTKGEKVRPHWEDGTFAYTIKRFGVCNRYDLRKEFPALTLRKTAIKSATDEMLWIWQRKSNNIHDLKSHVWDEWADDSGSIGKAYGYQMKQTDLYKDITLDKLKEAFPDGVLRQDLANGVEYFSNFDNPNNFIIYATRRYDPKTETAKNSLWEMDQINRVIYDLRLTPYSRRILTSIYNFHDLHDMHLYPCAYSMTFNVTKEPGQDKLTLNTILNQRSQDILAANNWNVVQYSILTMMIAQVCNMIPGEFVHMIADAHIYDRHVDAVKELISREPLPAPTVRLNRDIHNFYDFTTKDVIVENYQTHEQIVDIPIAV